MTTMDANTYNNTDRAYPVRIYVPSSRAESAAHVLITFRWKESTNKKTGITTPALSVPLFISIPKPELAVEPAILQAALQASYVEYIHDMLNEAIEKQLLEKKQPRSFHASEFSPEAVTTWLTDQASNRGKLSKELIEDWWAETMEQPLMEAFSQLSAIDTDEKLQLAVSQRKAGFLKLAAPSFSMVPNDATQLLKALELRTAETVAEDTTGNKMQVRLENYMKPANELIQFNL